MGGAYQTDFQAAQFLDGRLGGSAKLAHNASIVTTHVIPILVRIDVFIQIVAIQGAERTESIGRKQNLVGILIGHHHLWPMHHRRHVESQLAFSQRDCVTFLDNKLLTIGQLRIITLQHAKGLGIANNAQFGIQLFQQTDGAGMVGFHVIHHQVVNLTTLQGCLQLVDKQARH